MNWRTQTVFVSGATGFIGGRVCERLVQAGVPRVRALVHTMHRAARISRLPVELCPGDLLDPSSLRSSLANSKVIIHCGLGAGSEIVRGTENLLALALEAGVQRFIHISTAAVHGILPPPGSETEDAPIRKSSDAYAKNKAAAEQIVLRYGQKGLPVVILRPSIVWGPYSAWSTRLMDDLRAGKVAYIDQGHGACNTTYVDNLVDAMFLAMENDEALNQVLNITDGERVTWGDFIRAHAAMMDRAPHVGDVSREELQAARRKQSGMLMGSVKAAARIARSKEFRQMLMQIPVTQAALKRAWNWASSLPSGRRERLRRRFGVKHPATADSNGRYVPDPVTVATQSATVFFSIEKARRILHYEPQINFVEGMRLVESWLRYAAYLE